MIFGSLEDKCKYYQKLADYRLMPNGFVIAHLDGRSFSRYCKRFEKPFDDDFIYLMNETAKAVASGTNGCVAAYVQSDEISLAILDDGYDNPFFGFRVCKLTSILASIATGTFIRESFMMKLDRNITSPCLYEDMEKEPIVQFDCKVWNVPTLNDVYAWFNFRQIDCIRNSKQILAQCHFLHNQLAWKNTDEQIEMVKNEKGIDWNDFSDGKKFGRFIKRVYVDKKLVDNDGNEVTVQGSKWEVFDAFRIQQEIGRDKFMKDFLCKDYK